MAPLAEMFVFYNYIAGYEERLLETKHGEAYKSYKQKTGKWLPKIGRDAYLLILLSVMWSRMVTDESSVTNRGSDTHSPFRSSRLRCLENAERLRSQRTCQTDKRVLYSVSGWGAFCLCLMAKTVIAIDGPAASGKSTTAKLVAQKLGFLYLDTGAMYRAITLKALERGIDVNDEDGLEKLAAGSAISFKTQDGANRILLDDRDVSQKIREPLVNQNVSYVSMHRKVRKLLVQMQEKMGEENDLVAEGRDTTTVVFPQAFKVYLDADLKERARRRLLELEEKGIEKTLEEQIEELSRRDKLDSGREASPLLRHKDAVIVDTTDLTIEQQVDRVVRLFREWKHSRNGSKR